MREHQSSTREEAGTPDAATEPVAGKATLASEPAGLETPLFEGTDWETVGADTTDGDGDQAAAAPAARTASREQNHNESQPAQQGGDNRQTMASASSKKKSGIVEKLAAQGVKVLGAIAGALDGAVEKIGDAEASRAKADIAALAKTCGPTTVGVQKRVQAKANVLNAYYLGKLLKTAFNQARKMKAACEKLRKNYKKNKLTALGTFVKDAFDAASAMSKAAESFRKSVSSVNQLVAQIGRRCHDPVQLEIAPRLKPLVRERPSFRLEIDKRIDIIGGRGIGISGLKLIGGKTVVPKDILKIDGPAQSIPLVA